jgi:predicted transcriptional regulator
MKKIEVDETTADVLEDAALARGVSVSELVADLVSSDLGDRASEKQAIAELDRRWNASQAEHATVAHEAVVEWLKSWGTPEFRPRRPR